MLNAGCRLQGGFGVRRRAPPLAPGPRRVGVDVRGLRGNIRGGGGAIQALQTGGQVMSNDGFQIISLGLQGLLFASQ